ncbi:MAG: NUDIX hydrolase [Pseudonocardia sp.]
MTDIRSERDRGSPAPSRHGDHADILAAGAVLWRVGSDDDATGGLGHGVQVALVHRPRYDDWTLPKGKLHRGESMPAAAIREVAEETGFATRLGSALGEVSYAVAEGTKLVRFWVAQALGGRFVPNAEVDEMRWVDLTVAADMLSYQRDLEVLRRFTAIGTPSATVLIVRHAKAGSRRQWDGDDDLRPLSRTGREQAQRVAELLPLFGPDRIVSAPPIRCRATVTPLAEQLGMHVTDEPLLSEDGYRLDPAAGLDRLHELVAQPGVTVVCSQGGVISDLVGKLAEEAHRRTGVDPDDVASRKASTWVLALRDGKLLTADYYPYPT